MTPDLAISVRAARLASIAVNSSFQLAPWADMLYGADAGWWRHHSQTALKLAGIKVTAQDSCEFRAVHLLKNTGSAGFDPNPANIRTGGNSGYQAIHVAIHAGASRILLLGFDMRGGHWHGDHPEPLTNPGPAEFARWIDRFDALNGRGPEIINCTPGSALRCFPFAPLENFA
jgi:hypothetical protein